MVMNFSLDPLIELKINNTTLDRQKRASIQIPICMYVLNVLFRA